VKLGSLSGPEALNLWLEAFANDVRASGLTGRLHATPIVRLPSWISQIAEPMVTAYVAVAASGRSQGEAEGWAERAVRWAAQAGGDAYVSSAGMNQLDTTGDVAAHLSAAFSATSSAAVLYADSGARRAAYVQIGAAGQATYQTYDPTVAPAAHADRARAAILAEAAQAQYAFVAATPQQAYSWDARGRALPPLRPEVPATALRGNADLWDRFVPDVHGIQLLTDEHLDRVSDLSQWIVTQVAAGRFLVEARDVAEWFGPGGPAQSVVDAARADFGRVLVSPGDLR
jgi:hypothetical protein